MRYAEAMRRLSLTVSADHIAEAAGVTAEELRRTRLDPDDEHYSPPPPNWRRALAQLAWERAALLQEFAKELEDEADHAVL